MNLRRIRQIDHYLGHALVALISPVFALLRRADRRPLALAGLEHIVIIKILGGGSLLVALPALLAIRQKYPRATISLVCSRQVQPFAELMGVFDRCHVVDTGSLVALALSASTALRRVFRAQAVVDLEVHSKLTSVFAALTLARVRVGILMDWNRWRAAIGTHFLFFNLHSLIADSYAQVARIFDCAVDYAETARWFRVRNRIDHSYRKGCRFARVVALAPFCSDLGREREFAPHEWAAVLQRKASALGPFSLLILGARGDAARGGDLRRALEAALPGCQIIDMIGATSLLEIPALLRQVDELLTIDSGINHVARLVGTKITSYWGPTSPDSRLAPLPGFDEEVHYNRVFCSPCVHAVAAPPCKGNNICMKSHVGDAGVEDRRRQGWLITGAGS